MTGREDRAGLLAGLLAERYEAPLVPSALDIALDPMVYEQRQRLLCRALDGRCPRGVDDRWAAA